MKGTSRNVLRGVAVLGAVAIAAGALSPALSAKKYTTKKQVKKLITNFGGKQFVSDEELFPVGPIHQQTGDPDQTIGTFGPFTLTTRCDVGGGGGARAQVLISTTEANSTLQSYDYHGDFQPAHGAINFSNLEVGNPPGGTTSASGQPYYYNGGHAIAPSGTSIIGVIDPITNFDGAHCYFDGYLQVLSA